MSNEKTGGPAYPRPASTQNERDGNSQFQWHPQSQQGMTLLDHFAGLAMQGICTSTSNGMVGSSNALMISVRSYAIAAAMIAERNRVMNVKP